jgi:peptidoglycan/LPS O-acetylase OafA/YrhL
LRENDRRVRLRAAFPGQLMTETPKPHSRPKPHSAEAERPAQSRSAGRLVALDAFRCLAAAGVVVIHGTEATSTDWLSRASRFSVPFFFAAGGYFAVRAGWGQRSWGDYALARVRRLYVPFLAWAGIYYAVRYAAHLAAPGRPAPYTSINLLADSPTQHLWFLPGLLVASVGAFTLARVFRFPGAPAAGAALGFAVLALAASFARLPEAPLFPYTTRMTWTYAPALLGGAAVTLLAARRAALPRWLGYAGVVAFLACIAWEVAVGRNDDVENAAGVWLLLAGIILPPPPGMSRLARWGALAFGVYVVHVLIIEAAQDAMKLAGTRPSLVRDLSIIAFALVASAVTTRVLMYWRWTRWMVASADSVRPGARQP